MVLVPAIFLLYLWDVPGRGAGAFFPRIFVAGWLVMAVFMLWRRWSAMGPGLVRVRLDASGCLQNDDPAATSDPVSLSWRVIGEVLLQETRGGNFRLTLKERRSRWRREYAAVDAEVRLTPKQAEFLRLWIDTCMRRAS
jgi:hypothetical protein